MQLATDRMIADIDGAIGWMTFNNPARRNAVSVDMWEAILDILDAFERDPAVRVIVLKGAGDKAFVAGADISQFEQQRSSAEAIKQYEIIVERANKRLATVGKPTIAMINGFCIGGGLGIALACDLRIAAENATFAIPAAKLGLGYGAGGIKKLVDVVGPAFAKEIFYTARQFDVEEARIMGLVNRVVAVPELETYVRDMCATIAGNAPLTIGASKRVIDELSKMPEAVDIELCEQVVETCFDSADYVEGRRAFMEKRKPVFQGR